MSHSLFYCVLGLVRVIIVPAKRLYFSGFLYILLHVNI